MNVALRNRRSAPCSHFSGMGSISEDPVIEEVYISRDPKKTGLQVVKNGYMPKTDFNYPPGGKVKFTARLKGSGYFYATISDNRRSYLLFVTPVKRVVEKVMTQETMLRNLQFHIAHNVPTNLDLEYMDNESRRFLRNNPQSYSTLGNLTPKFGDDIPEYDNKNWDGRVNYYKWEHGITGKKTQKHNKPINFYPSYSGSWACGGVAFEYTDKGWDALKQQAVVKDVEVPMAIWGKVLHLRNTFGAGGEYVRLGHEDSQHSDYRTLPKECFSMVSAKAMSIYMDYDHDWYNKSPAVQTDGYLNTALTSGARYKVSTLKPYMAQLEWFDEATETWSAPSPHPPKNIPLNSNGEFKVVFRFPKQSGGENNIKCYPTYDDVDKGLVYRKLGAPETKDGKYIRTETSDGQTVIAKQQSAYYYPMFRPPFNLKKDVTGNQGQDGDNHVKYLSPIIDCEFNAVDDEYFDRMDNPDFLKAYWVNGQFKPGGSFFIVGKALDSYPSIWVSSETLASGKGRVNDLSFNQYNLKRDSSINPPNSQLGDRVRFTRYYSTDFLPENIDKKPNLKTDWKKVFGNTPCNDKILSLMLRGDQLPELEGIENEKLPGFLDDDPLRYKGKTNTQFRHPYTVLFCKIPETWWGPSLEFSEAGDLLNGPEKVFFGGMNLFFYIKEEEINLKNEIKFQQTLIEAGYNAAEAAAASNLENRTVDKTEEYYKSIQDDKDKAPQKQRWWPFRREEVNFRHQKYLLSGLGSVGEVTDVTEKYSADHMSGISPTNVRQYGFNDLYLVNGVGDGPSMILTPSKEPRQTHFGKLNTHANFGSSSRLALASRARGGGNPLTYSTEDKLATWGGFGNVEGEEGEEEESLSDKASKMLGRGAGLATGEFAKAVGDYPLSDVMKVAAGAAVLSIAFGYASKPVLQGTLGGLGSFFGNFSRGRQQGKAARQLAKQSKKNLRGL